MKKNKYLDVERFDAQHIIACLIKRGGEYMTQNDNYNEANL